MKMRTIILALAVLAGLSLASCKKDNSGGGTNPGSNGSMSLTVGGSSWNADLAVQGVNSNGVINVTGSDNTGHQASVILYQVSAPGTYKVGPNGASGNQLRWTEGINAEQTFVASFVLGEGTVTVTELSASNIKGTFSFTGYNTDQESRVVTNGSFEANF